jgi:hypothetical protein
MYYTFYNALLIAFPYICFCAKNVNQPCKQKRVFGEYQ